MAWGFSHSLGRKWTCATFLYMIRAETTAAAAGDLEPNVIWFESRRVEVRAVSDRWFGATQRWWKVDTDEGSYVLRYDEQPGTWALAAVVGR
jgi:hypothetical protein